MASVTATPLRGRIAAGTAVAVLFLASLRSGLDISGVSSFWQQVVTGSVLVLAVGFGQARKQLTLMGRKKGSS